MIWLYHYLVFDIWNPNIMAWHMAKCEDLATTADLVSNACFREWISKGWNESLILYVDNGNIVPAAIRESRLDEMGVLRSFSRQRVYNDNPCSESLFRIAKHKPNNFCRPFNSEEAVCN
jgi:putative transposase